MTLSCHKMRMGGVFGPHREDDKYVQNIRWERLTEDHSEDNTKMDLTLLFGRSVGWLV
jgi:hypothetical protein